VADDCSIDGSVEIVRNLQQKFIYIRLIENKRNVKLAKNKDNACRLAKGEYLTFIDSDDFNWKKDKIQQEYELIQKLKTKGVKDPIAFSLVVFVDEQGELIRSRRHEEVEEGDIFFKMITRGLKFVPRDFLLTKKQYGSVGFSSLKGIESKEFWIRNS
jgi:glycosyltransferase involved in cell wall biosynthesis